MAERITMDDGANISAEFELLFDPRKGGEIKVSATESGVVASRPYNFRTWFGQELYEWHNVRGSVDGDALAFVLPPTKPE
jgi:hypothetical protein